ncbi:MAG: hypothetical protein ACUVSU_13005 [Aggregatilineaceae bacterium]
MAEDESRTLWALALAGVSLYAWQTALTDMDGVIVRYVGLLAITVGAAWWTGHTKSAWPEPATLALGALAALSVWAAIWWAMDATNHVLQLWIGPLAWPRSIAVLDDRVLGVRLAPLNYELSVLFAVVLVPIAQGWLLWGGFQSFMTVRLGPRHAVGLTALLGGALLTLSAMQGVAPALPWGTAALPGYALLALLATLATHFSASLWTGVVVHATFAYASFAWQDDLFREFAGAGYLSPRWLTVVVLGTLGAMVCLQIMRFRREDGAAASAAPQKRLRRRDWWPLALLVVMVMLLAGRDASVRRDEAHSRANPAASQPAQQ